MRRGSTLARSTLGHTQVTCSAFSHLLICLSESNHKARLMLFDSDLVTFAGDVHDCLNVSYPHQFLLFQVFENTTQCRCSIGRANHKRMNADRDDRSLPVGISLGLPCQFG